MRVRTAAQIRRAVHEHLQLTACIPLQIPVTGSIATVPEELSCGTALSLHRLSRPAWLCRVYAGSVDAHSSSASYCGPDMLQCVLHPTSVLHNVGIQSGLYVGSVTLSLRALTATGCPATARLLNGRHRLQAVGRAPHSSAGPPHPAELACLWPASHPRYAQPPTQFGTGSCWWTCTACGGPQCGFVFCSQQITCMPLPAL
jgi:hypothetical protein